MAGSTAAQESAAHLDVLGLLGRISVACCRSGCHHSGVEVTWDHLGFFPQIPGEHDGTIFFRRMDFRSFILLAL